LTAEVQVRSVLQHAWAAISRKLDYKVATQAPIVLRRRLFRLSALLELADDEFAGVRDEAVEISKFYGKEVERGDLDLPLDLNSLGQFLQRHARLDEWERIGRAAGMLAAQPVTSDQAEAAIRQLLATLQHAGMSSLAELEGVLSEARAEAPVMLGEFAKAVQTRGRPFEAYGVDVITVVVSLSKAHEIGGGNPWSFFFTHIVDALRECMSHRRPHDGGAA
jgi:hypothetical protein